MPEGYKLMGSMFLLVMTPFFQQMVDSFKAGEMMDGPVKYSG